MTIDPRWAKSQERRGQVIAELKELKVYSKRFRLAPTVDLMEFLYATKLAKLENEINAAVSKQALDSYDAGYADGSYNMLVNLLDAKVPSVLDRVEGIGPKRMEAIKTALNELRATYLQERDAIHEVLKQ